MADKPQDSSTDPIAYRVFNEIGIINQLSTSAFRRVLPAPLNTAMFGVLNNFVRLGDGKSPSELASAFQVTRPSMTNTIAKLERAGFVTVEAGVDDARTKRVWITPAGRDARNRAVEATSGLFAGISSELAQINLEALAAKLGRLREILDRERD